MRLVRSVAAGLVLAGAVAGSAGAQTAAQTGSQTAAAPSGAVACGGCHAGSGAGGIPSLNGLKSNEISAAMLDYKADRRAPTIMNRIARGFSEGEIKAIAEWLEAHP